MTERALSVFIDESGDFGAYEPHTPYYLVTLVLHDQSIDISDNIASFETHLRNLGYEHHAIHTGPLIRRESDYANDLIEDRKRLFNSLFNFARKLEFHYASVVVSKRECSDEIDLTSRISKQLGEILDTNQIFFSGFDKIIVYYDNGQINLTRIISSVFSSHFANIEFRKVQPVDYRLFQIADMICTMVLLAEKAERHSFTSSELEFFDNIRTYKKNYWKWIEKKHL